MNRLAILLRVLRNAALRHFDAALRLEPQSARAHRALGQVYLEQHEFGLAVSEFAEVTRLRPQFAEGYYDLGLALENERHPRRAAQAFRQALKHDGSLLAAQRELNSLESAGKGIQRGDVRHVKLSHLGF